MTLIEMVAEKYNLGKEDLDAIVIFFCPFEYFSNFMGANGTQICHSDCCSNEISVDCPLCWSQEYKEEFGFLKDKL